MTAIATKPRPLFVKLDATDRARLEQLAVDGSVAAGKPITLSDVIRGLVRDAFDRRGKRR